MNHFKIFYNQLLCLFKQLFAVIHEEVNRSIDVRPSEDQYQTHTSLQLHFFSYHRGDSVGVYIDTQGVFMQIILAPKEV